jgi:hypothetical protein
MRRQVRERETVQLAGVNVDEVSAPPAAEEVVRWTMRAIMQVHTTGCWKCRLLEIRDHPDKQ